MAQASRSLLASSMGPMEQGKNDALQGTAQTRIKSLLEHHALDRSYRFMNGTLSHSIVSAARSRCVGFCPFDTHCIVSPMGRT